jgi:hypothetical protein
MHPHAYQLERKEEEEEERDLCLSCLSINQSICLLFVLLYLQREIYDLQICDFVVVGPNGREGEREREREREKRVRPSPEEKRLLFALKKHYKKSGKRLWYYMLNNLASVLFMCVSIIN